MENIRTVLALQIGTAFVLLMLGVYWIVQERLTAATEALLIEQQTVLAANTAAQVERAVGLRMQVLERAAQGFPAALIDDTQATQDYLQTQTGLLGVFDHVTVLRPDGIQRADMPDRGLRGKRVLRAAYKTMTEVMRTRRTLMSRPYVSRIGIPIIGFGSPIVDGDGRVVGVLGATLSILSLGEPLSNNLLGWLPDTPIGRSGYFYLLHKSERRIIAHRDRGRVFTAAPPPGTNPLLDRALAGANGGGRGVNSRGLDAIQGFKSIPAHDWLLGAVLPADEALVPLRGHVRELLLWIVAVAIVGALLAWMLLSLRLAPLVQLRRALGYSTAHPERHAPLHVSGRDEVAMLMLGYNEAMSAIHRYLEARVEAESGLVRLNRMYRMLTEVNHATVRERSVDQLLGRVCGIVVDSGLFEMAFVASYRLGDRSMRIEAQAGNAGPYLQDALRLGLPDDDSVAQPLQVMFSGESRFRNHVDDCGMPEPWRTMTLSHGYRASASLPLKQKGEVLWVLRIFSATPGFFDDAIRRLLQDLSEDIGFALDFIAESGLRRQAEAELIAANAQLEENVARRTEQLERTRQELEAFSYNVSHDLRAPLRTIQGFAGEVEQTASPRLDADGRALIARVLDCASHMNHMIDDLLLFAQLGRYTLERRPLDLTALAHEILARLQAAEPLRVVEVRVEEDMRLLADPRMMRHILENLLGNAWKFSGRQTRARVEIGCERHAGETVYFVRDNGAGFDPRFSERLFEPFQRLHRREDFPGTGIGLATVAKLVRRHGGRVWAEGRPGEGAVFRFTLEPADLSHG